MRNSTTLIKLALGAGAILSAVFVQAAEPAQAPVPKADCRAVNDATADGRKCATGKTAPAAARPRLMQVTRATLDRNICNRQATKIERDTCLNRVESTA